MTPRSTHGGHARRRRWRIAIGIAIVEGVVVALSSDVSRWTVIGLAAVAFALQLTVGRKAHSGIAHDVLWIFACSQALAVVLAVCSFFVSWLVYGLAALLAVVMLVLLLFDRRR